MPYLTALAARGYQSCLITFERAPYAMSDAAAATTARSLSDAGICWHPVRYHRRSTLGAAAFDYLSGLATAVGAIVRHRARFVHTRASLTAPIGLLASGLMGRRFLYDADSELSQEYVDGGHWSAGGLRHRLLSSLERVCRKHADGIVVLTDRLRLECRRADVAVPIAVIPCCVDVKRFAFDSRQREIRRAELGIGSGKLLVYVGKLGPRYLVDEAMDFVRAVQRCEKNVRLLVLTQEDPDAFHRLARNHGLAEIVTVTRAAPQDVPAWLWAADAGLALIRSSPSERGSSPIKISEYLAAGLPVVTMPSIGDISAIVESERLGVVIRSTTPADYEGAAETLRDLWDGQSETRRRCAAWAGANLSLEDVGVPRYSQLYQTMLSGAAPLLHPSGAAHE